MIQSILIVYTHRIHAQNPQNCRTELPNKNILPVRIEITLLSIKSTKSTQYTQPSSTVKTVHITATDTDIAQTVLQQTGIFQNSIPNAETHYYKQIASYLADTANQRPNQCRTTSTSFSQYNSTIVNHHFREGPVYTQPPGQLMRMVMDVYNREFRVSPPVLPSAELKFV